MTAAALFAAAAAALGTVGTIELVAARHERRGVQGRRRSRVSPRGIPRALRWLPGAARPVAGRDLEARLEAAGVAVPAADYVLVRGAAAVAGLLLVLPLAWAAPGRAGIALLLAGPGAGYLTPAVWLARRTRRRAAGIERELADVLDLLRVAVAAGLPAGRAMGEVGRRMHGVLAVELDAAAARMQLGAPRAEALRELVARCPCAGVATLAAAIARADRHGAPLAPALEALAAEARAEQARRVRDAAARAAPKIQLVVALVLVPAVMLLLGAVLVQGLTSPG
jgi:tight adherence protein C